jgi:hypothetical protein
MHCACGVNDMLRIQRRSGFGFKDFVDPDSMTLGSRIQIRGKKIKKEIVCFCEIIFILITGKVRNSTMYLLKIFSKE